MTHFSSGLIRASVLPVLVVLLSVPSAGRADSLDAPLAGYVNKEVLLKLRDREVKNVGVLPFRFKKHAGKTPGGRLKTVESYVGAPICADMPTRLENTLILLNPKSERDGFGVIRDAAATVASKRVGNWDKDPNARKKLFTLDYNKAWGYDRAGNPAKVKASAFLTGLVDNTAPGDKTLVVIEAIFASDPLKKVELTRFTFTPDRALLANLGYNFNLNRKLVRARNSIDRDRQVVSLVRRRDEGLEPPLRDVTLSTPDNVGGFAVGIQYGGSPVEIQPLSEGSNEYFVPPVPAGSEFVLTLEYKGELDSSVGVVVKVNGKSTWQQEEGDSINLRKWIYTRENANKVDPFKGFYLDVEGNYLPFKVLTAEESQARVSAEPGDRMGWIDIDVFAPGTATTMDEPKRVSSRGVPSQIKNKKIQPFRPTTLAMAQEQLSVTNYLKRSKVLRRAEEGGLIMPDDSPQASERFSTGQLPYPVLIGSLRIRYFDPARLRVTP